MNNVVYVVHCIDTEGPLYESLDAKFERLENIIDVSDIERTQETFDRLLRGEIDLGGKEELVRQIFSSHLCNYMENWAMLEDMLSRATSAEFRLKTPDSFGGAYIYNWFCVDHVNYDLNPRRRTLGYHAIFDYYRDFVQKQDRVLDGLHWHFHPMSTYREAHRCATSLLQSPHITETLARRIIERAWFPSCCRCGFQSERPDTHWFLEQYFPFDYTNTSVEDYSEIEEQKDLANGRFCDWRIAPKDWGVYHPSHDNYQVPGNCRRLIARALNLLNRFASIDACEVEKAFAQAREGRPALLGVVSHDYRDLVPEVEHLRDLLVKAQAKFPDVDFKFSEAQDAIRAVAFGGEIGPALELEIELQRDARGMPLALTVETKQGEVFGPQPFLAIQTRSQKFIHDNLDFSTDLKSWRYVFDIDSVRPDDVIAVGIGANDKYGHTLVKTIEV
jgi:hypothetical protein